MFIMVAFYSIFNVEKNMTSNKIINTKNIYHCPILLFQSIPLMLIPLFRLLICLAVTVSVPFVEYWLSNRYLHLLLMRERIFFFPFSMSQFILIFLYCTACPFLFLFLALQQFSCLLQFVL